MAFFNTFFRKRKTGKHPEPRQTPETTEPHAPSEKRDAAPSVRFGVGSAVVRGHRTEKSAAAEPHGVYTFVVRADATKREVKRSVEVKYGVTVRAVHAVTVPGKMRRRGRQVGWKTGFKKAFVTLEKGQSIDLG